MIRALLARRQQKRRTITLPRQQLTLPERFRGLPNIDENLCHAGMPSACQQICVAVCPSSALAGEASKLTLDLGRCIFCGRCAEVCPVKALTFTRGHQLCARTQKQLHLGPGKFVAPPLNDLAASQPIRKLLGRSLKLRQVSAAGCNACEADLNVLSTVVFDLGQYGIQFVASPRHADGLVVTGPVSLNMAEALRKTYDAIPAPKIVIAVGACAISGGLFAAQSTTVPDSASALLPVDLFIPGCPPHPATILDGILRFMGTVSSL